MPGQLPEGVVNEVALRALAEDVGSGDVTTLATVSTEQRATAALLPKAEGVVAGLPIMETVFRLVDPSVKFEAMVADGDTVAPGRSIADIAGPARAVLTGERTALNFLQRLSGIATLTARFVAAVEGTGVQILDTRKTTPGLRALEKYAVRMGGGRNHRFGLSDGVLIKDNHIAAAGGITRAVTAAQATAHQLLRIEVEVDTLAQVTEALRAGADVIMLDNMTPEDTFEAVRTIHEAGRKVEISGGVTLASVRDYAACRPDYISVGALTHSAPALDFSLELTTR